MTKFILNLVNYLNALIRGAMGQTLVWPQHWEAEANWFVVMLF